MKTNKVEHCRWWCLWNKSRLQIFRIRNRRRRIRRISRQNKYEKSLAGYFCSDTGVTTLRPSSLVQFIFSLKTATMRRIGPVNGRTSTVCLKNISVLDVCTENGTREEREKVTKELNFLPICLSSTAIYFSLWFFSLSLSLSVYPSF